MFSFFSTQIRTCDEVLEKWILASSFIRAVPIIVAASQYTLAQRRPDSSTISIFLVQVSIFILELVPDEHVVLWLLYHWCMEIVLLTDLDGLGYLGSAPFRGAPVESHALVNQPRKGTTSFLQRGCIIISVSEYHIHVI
jgi:hypothetical protein